MALIIELSLCLYITTTGGILGSAQNPTMIPSTGKLLRLNIGMTTGLYEPPKRILIVCSSHPRGIHLSEFAEPYNILRKKFGGKERIEFVIASPKGGSIPIDANSHPKTDIQRREWASAIRLLSQPTHPTIDHQYAFDYDGIYLPGGYAPMFDLADHRLLKDLLADFDEQMKPIAAICHGVVGLVNVRRTQSNLPLIQGRVITGFSLEEEMVSTSGINEDDTLVNKVPFVLETKLKDQGALYMKSSPGKEHVLQDGLLLTGQNPASARQLAHRFADLIEQCAAHDYQQVNLTSSLPKTLITCHVSTTNNHAHLLSKLKLAHLEFIQRHQHLIVFSGSTLFTDPNNITQQDAASMVILLATGDQQQAQRFIDQEPYAASKQVFDRIQIKSFKQLFPGASNQQLLNYHLQQELIKSHQQRSRHEHR